MSNLTFDKFCMANYGNLINLFSNDNIEVNPEIKKLMKNNRGSYTEKYINDKGKTLSAFKSYYN